MTHLNKLQELVTIAANKHLDKTAVIYDEGFSGQRGLQITYRKLLEQVAELTSSLAEYFRQDQIIALMLKSSCDIPSILLSILSSNCAFFPLSSDGLRYNVNGMKRVKVSWLLFQSSYQEVLLSALDQSEAEIITNSILLKYQLKLVKLAFGPSASETSIHGPVAYCITTSGTTSSPKVVKVPHSCIVPNILSLRDIFKVKCTDKFLLSSPLTFDPSMIDIFVSLSSGAALLLVPDEVKRNPAKLLHVIYDRQAVTILQATPSLIARFSPHQLRKTLLGTETPLRLLALGGEQFPTGEEVKEWTDPANKTQFFNLYGITEVSCWASCEKVDIKALIEYNKSIPIGKALDKTFVKISAADSQLSNEGNILIGSAERVCLIDCNNTSDGKHAQNHFDALPSASYISRDTQNIVWRDSGDHGRLMPNGSIIYLGRKDDQIKRNGKRLNISAIEEICRQLQSVSDCKVLLSEENRLTAFIIISRDQPPTSLHNKSTRRDLTFERVSLEDEMKHEQLHNAKTIGSIQEDLKLTESEQEMSVSGGSEWEKVKDEVINRLKLSLPSHYMPDVFVEISHAFPITAHGKLDKRCLLKIANLSHTDSSLFLKSPHEWAIKLWQIFLPANVEQVQGDDNFLTLGGDSLASLGLINTLEKYIRDAANDFLDILFNKTFAHFVENLKIHSHLFTSKEASLHRNLSPEMAAAKLHHADEVTLVTSTGADSFTLNYSSKQKPSSALVFDVIDHVCVEEEKIWTSNCDSKNISHNMDSDKMLHQSISHDSMFSPRIICKIISRGNRISHAKKNFHGNFNQPFHRQRNQCFQFDDDERNDDSAKSIEPFHTSKGYHIKDRPHVRDISVADNASEQTFSAVFPFSERSPQHEKFTSFKPAENDYHLMPSWKFNTGKCVDASPVIAVIQNESVVFTGSHSGHFCAIDLNSGSLLWRSTLPDRIESSGCCTLDLRYIIIGCYDGGIYALNINSGSIEWCFKTQDIVKCSPAVDENSGHVLCGSHDGSLYCLNIEDKDCVWQKYLKGGGILASPLINHDTDIVVVATLRGKVYTLECNDGRTVWWTDLEKPIFSSPCFHDKNILVGCLDNTLYCISDMGRIVWKFNTNGPIFSSPVSYRQHIYFGCHDCHMYCLDYHGQVKWSINGQSTIFSTPFIFHGRKIRTEKNKTFFVMENSTQQKSRPKEYSSVTSQPLEKCVDLNMKKRSAGSTIYSQCGTSNEDAAIFQGPQNMAAKHHHDKSTPHNKETTFYDHPIQSEPASEKFILSELKEGTSDESGRGAKSSKDSVEEDTNIQTDNFMMEDSSSFIAVASTKGTLYVVDVETSCVAAEKVLPGEVFSSPIVWNNKLVIGCRDNFIYCHDFMKL